ncbi:helix-turn-helix domain-containing protein [Escherichia coli]|uniref:helix-turn-helix domain-containing protein n=1 Tax=Escherichia coli TaxID=562 RepID=UPI0038B31776
MAKIRNTEDKILRVYTGTLRVLFIFTERYLAFYGISYFRTVLYEKVRDVSRMTLQNKVIAGVIAFAEHLLESESRSDISQLVRYSGYSRRHLQRLFRNKTGMSVGDYIRRRRLTRAAMLVRLTGYPLHDIAISVGFDSQPSFNREFRKRFGCSPGIYRSRPGWDLSLLTPRAELDETFCGSCFPEQLLHRNIQHIQYWTNRLLKQCRAMKRLLSFFRFTVLPVTPFLRIRY